MLASTLSSSPTRSVLSRFRPLRRSRRRRAERAIVSTNAVCRHGQSSERRGPCIGYAIRRTYRNIQDAISDEKHSQGRRNIARMIDIPDVVPGDVSVHAIGLNSDLAPATGDDLPLVALPIPAFDLRPLCHILRRKRASKPNHFATTNLGSSSFKSPYQDPRLRAPYRASYRLGLSRIPNCGSSQSTHGACGSFTHILPQTPCASFHFVISAASTFYSRIGAKEVASHVPSERDSGIRGRGFLHLDAPKAKPSPTFIPVHFRHRGDFFRLPSLRVHDASASHHLRR